MLGCTRLPKNIQLEYNSEEARIINKQTLTNKAWFGRAIAATGILSTVTIVILFNIFIMFPLWFSFLLFLIFFALFYYLLEPYIEAMYLYTKRPQKIDEGVFIGKGKFIQIKDKNSYLIASPTAKCIAPHCPGKITVVHAPPKEVPRLNKKYVGICTHTGKDHSYYIDYNLVATPERFDWSLPRKE